MLKEKKYENIEKFVQEVFWRTYWKGWLEGRSGSMGKIQNVTK